MSAMSKFNPQLPTPSRLTYPDQDLDPDPDLDQDLDQDLDPDLDQDQDQDLDLDQDPDLDPDLDRDPDLDHFCFKLRFMIYLFHKKIQQTQFEHIKNVVTFEHL